MSVTGDGSEKFWEATFRENLLRRERLQEMVQGADPRAIERAGRAAARRDAAGEDGAGESQASEALATDPLAARARALLDGLPPHLADADGLARGLAEAVAGLTQASAGEGEVVQLKRALRGLTFARGAALAARADGAPATEGVLAEIDAITDPAIDRLRALRSKLPGGV